MKKTLALAVSRTATLVCLAAIGTILVMSTIPAGSISTRLTGLGMVVLGISSFFQPVPFRVPLREVFSASNRAAIGSDRFRALLSTAAVGLIFASLVVRVLPA